jgi:hypothetical protein
VKTQLQQEIIIIIIIIINKITRKTKNKLYISPGLAPLPMKNSVCAPGSHKDEFMAE